MWFNSARNCLLHCIKYSCPRNAAQTCSVCMKRTTSLRSWLLLYTTRTTSKRAVGKTHTLYLTVDKNSRIMTAAFVFWYCPHVVCNFWIPKMFFENYSVFFPKWIGIFPLQKQKSKISLPALITFYWIALPSCLCSQSMHQFWFRHEAETGLETPFFHPSTKTQQQVCTAPSNCITETETQLWIQHIELTEPSHIQTGILAKLLADTV